jgi:hypothetical protein
MHSFSVGHLHMLNDVGVDRTLEAVVLGAVFLPSTARNAHWASRRAGSWLAMVRGCVGELFLNGLVGSWQENDLAVCRFGHLLHSFEISKTPISHNV